MRATTKRVVVALSGGVDSSVCVHLLKQQGYEVVGLVLKMSDHHDNTVELAKKSAKSLDIELIIKDCRDLFEKNVIDYFCEQYINGKTPNPCIACNPSVKFKTLVQTADELGFDYIATGHYANIACENGYYYLEMGDSQKRDQSYMLYRLGQDVLSRLILPLSNLQKDEVREIAKELGLSCFNLPDSQEICFIPDNNYAKYIEDRVGKKPKGDFISPDGKPCGQHQGILHYTVGQRKGLGIALGQPVFIKKIDAKTNQIFLSKAGENLTSVINAENLVLTKDIENLKSFECEVKIRSVSTPTKAEININNDNATINFKTPQKLPASGQSIVFYKGKRVLGGGIMVV